MPDTTLREALARLDLPMLKETRPPVLQLLLDLGAVMPGATQVTVVRMNNAVKLYSGLGYSEARVLDLQRLVTARPPPTRHQGGAAVAAVPGQQYDNMHFPAVLPQLRLTPAQLTGPYGMPKRGVTRALNSELDAFGDWSCIDINTERGTPFAASVQTATIKKQRECLRSCLGFFVHHLHIPVTEISLDDYGKPHYVAHFIAFLMARGVGKGQLCKHISLAKKVNCFLQSGAPEGSAIRRHVARMDAWLATLERQINASMPNQQKPESLPQLHLIREWAHRLITAALRAVDQDHVQHGCMRAVTAIEVRLQQLCFMGVGEGAARAEWHALIQRRRLKLALMHMH